MAARIQRLLDRKASLTKDSRSILDKAESDGQRDTSEAENEILARNNTELEAVEKDIERENRLMAYERNVAPAIDDPNVEAQALAERKANEAKSAKFDSFGEFLQGVMAMTTGQATPQQRTKFQAAATGLNEVTPSQGGFLVNIDFASDLVKRTYENTILGSRVQRVGISGNANGLKINAVDETSRATGSRWGGVQVYRTNEAGSTTTSKPKLRQMELNLKKLVGICYATEEALEDAAALESIMMQAFSEEFAFVIDDEILNGGGAGQMYGILNSSALISVSKETGQAAATIQLENVVKMWARLWGRSQQNAIWLTNQDTFPSLYTQGINFGVGGQSVFIPPGGLSAQPYATILGRPVIVHESCQTLGTVGDLLLVDPTQYLMIDKGGFKSAASMHVAFLTGEMAFRFTLRNDGQPIWNSALTPKNGSNTVSPYVALATRS